MSERCLTVPIHLDALTVRAEEAVAGPTLDITQAPWLGRGDDGVLRDHFEQTANVAGAMRIDPMAPSNQFLRPGLHLHWALPDAMTHGATTRPSGPFVERGGLWFPEVPNRWLVMETVGGSLKRAWLVESDHVHGWGEGGDAVAYPVPVGRVWKHPYVRLGRATELLIGGTVSPPSKTLAAIDAPLTAVGPNDPSFAALYPSSHSVFGLFIDGLTPKASDYEVIGWYQRAAADPLAAWRKLPPIPRGGSEKTMLRDVLGRDHDGAPPVIDNLKKARLDATRAIFAERTHWTVDPGKVAALSKATRLVCYAKITIDPKIKDPTPKPLTSRIAVGASTEEALAAYIADHPKFANADTTETEKRRLEDRLEAVRFASEMADHALDVTAKLAEYRHRAGFRTTGARMLWSIRPTVAAVAAPHEHDPNKVQGTLPETLAHALNRLNMAEDALDDQVERIKSLRQQVFTDWSLYMLAAYPKDDRADFALDVDLLRDVVLKGSIAALDKAKTDVTTLTATRDRLNAEAGALVAAHNKKTHTADALTLAQVPGPRYWQPNDPVIAIGTENAVAATRRHGQDGRARKDLKVACLPVTVSAFPEHTATRASLTKFRDAVIAGAGADFVTISGHKQGLKSWNAILLDWEASVKAITAGTNLTGGTRSFSKDVVTRHYRLPETAPDLAFQPSAMTAAERREIAEEFGRPVSGRTILSRHGGTLLASALDRYQTDLTAAGKTLPSDLASVKSWLKTKAGAVVTISLGGLNERLLMHRTEPQVPVADPLGFSDDQTRAAEVAQAVSPVSDLYSPEPDGVFLPLRAAELVLQRGRIIDTFGRWVDWRIPDGFDGKARAIRPARTLADSRGERLLLPVRPAQPARVDFRWFSAEGDLESNDHPATSPVCGWLIPNDFDRNILVYDAPGRLLGIVEETGIWQPAPGDQRAPLGPALIPNQQLSRVAQWLVSHKETGFMDTLLSVFDTGLFQIDPKDHSSQKSRALLVGRPIAVARARVDLRLQGPPASDHSNAAMALRIAGLAHDDHGFGDIRFPIRIGEHRQFNDGLVGYFVDASKEHAMFYAPQSAKTAAAHPAIKIYDAGRKEPLSIERSFNDPPADLTLLLDPRCPVHVTTGILPTKAIDIPRDQFMPAMERLEAMFAATPILTPAGEIRLPLPSEPDARWTWIEMGDGVWREVPAEPHLDRAALKAAYPGRVYIDGGKAKDLDAGAAAPSGKEVRQKADLIWEELIEKGWIAPAENEGARVMTPRPKLGHQLNSDEIAVMVTKMASHVKPAMRHAAFGPRAEAREGWLKMTPRSASRQTRSR